MRILMVNGLVPWHPQAGGREVIAYKLSEALARKGHDITSVSICPIELRREVEWGEIIYLDNTKFFSQFLRAFREGARNYDLIHLHLEGDITGSCLGYSIGKMLKRHKIIMGLYPPEVHGFPRNFSEAFYIISCRFVDSIFALSQFSKENISSAYHISPSKIKVTYAGVEDSFFKKKRNILKKDNFTLLFCGRLNVTEYKGVDILLKAMPHIIKEHNVGLKIIGVGERLEEYKALARELNIEKYVRFLGFIKHKEMPKHYSEADLFVFPSRRESFGLVLAEAMAAGLPVVSTKVGAIPEVVKNGETGILVPSNDSQKFAEAVNSLLNNPEKMKTMGSKGRERVQEYFTWGKVAESVVKFYQEVL